MDRIFLTQISLSAVMVGFCICMIAINNTTDSRSVYLPILTSVVGVWLPSPSSANTKKVDPLLPL
jgi:hypothetical protein